MTAATPGRADEGAWHGPLPQLPEKWAGTPGQADGIPAAFGGWVRMQFPPEIELPKNEIAGRWKHMTGPAEREFWREVDAALAAQQPKPAPDARRALLDIIAEVGRLDEPGPAADYIRLLAEYGLGDAPHPGDSTEPKAAPELAPVGDENSAAFKMGLVFEEARAMGEPLSACWEAAYQTAWEHWIGRPPEPAPELAAAMRETREVRDGYARLCEEFGDHPQSGQSARISLTVLNRHRKTAGLSARRPAPVGERRDAFMQMRDQLDKLGELAGALNAEADDNECSCESKIARDAARRVRDLLDGK